MAMIEERKDSKGKVHFRAMVRIKGHPVKSKTFDRKTDAKNWAAQEETDIRSGRSVGAVNAKSHTFKEAAERYRKEVLPHKRANTIAGQTIQLKFWEDHLGPLALGDINTGLLSGLKASMKNRRGREKKAMSAATQRRYFAVLSHLFNTARKEWQWCLSNPVADLSKPKEPAGRVRFLDAGERTRLMAECRASQCDILEDVVILAMLTGMRQGEILGLVWSEVSFERKEITLPPERVKNNTRRTVPLADACGAILLNRYKDRKANCDLVFPAPGHGNAKPRTYDIRTAFENAVLRAEIKNFHFHDLRHCFASYVAMNTTANALELATLMGHKSIQMTARYAHLSSSHLAKTNQQMANAIMGTTNPAQPTEETAS